MKPTILLDKSTLQALSQEELHFLLKYYYLNIPPILVKEIRADLTKKIKDSNSNEQHVANLSKKLLGNDSQINIRYEDIILNELLGNPVNTKIHQPLLNSTPDLRNGKKGVIMTETKYHRLIKGWQHGFFSDDDYDFASNWRKSVEEFDIDQLRTRNLHIFQHFKELKINSLQRINEFILEQFNNPARQHDLLTLILEINYINQDDEKQIFNRWNRNNNPMLEDFCPYSLYYLQIFELWYYGTLKSLLGRKSDALDIEYLFYLPFTHVFSSEDRILKQFIPLILKDNQVFLSDGKLKNDLKNIAKHWQELCAVGKIDFHKRFGNKPTDMTPLTLGIWERYQPTKEIFQNPNSELDFFEIQRLIHIDDPCPCGTGVPYKDCHGKMQPSINSDYEQ
ncbi:MAG: SEC-C domain-containing protein [Saprospiraceae bacterium]|nr:SEC-C domain-containing protein [Saprospiraceae bacterium]